MIILIIMTIALVISHATAIFFLRKQFKGMDLATTEAKRLGIVMTLLHVEIPILLAIIWFAVAPAIAPAH